MVTYHDYIILYTNDPINVFYTLNHELLFKKLFNYGFSKNILLVQINTYNFK